MLGNCGAGACAGVEGEGGEIVSRHENASCSQIELHDQLV